MTMTNHEQTIESITITSLEGNMGDGWKTSAHEAYCEFLEEQLQKIHPSAEIDIIQSDASGWESGPQVTRFDGECPDHDVISVENAYLEIWQQWCASDAAHEYYDE